MKADAIMDLSSFGKTEEFRKKLIAMSTAMVGTVPVYDAIGFYDKGIKGYKGRRILDVVRKHAEDGDFVTIHAGLNREAVEPFKRNEKNNILFQEEALIYAWMELNNAENPFYETLINFLIFVKEYDMTISLGDALRSGCLNDATDASNKRAKNTGRIDKRAWKRNVQIIIEGPGHMATDEIEANVKLGKETLSQCTFYVLGPLVTDTAPGYDHITSAIGWTIAAVLPELIFSVLCTPAEHPRLPNLDDMKEGIIASPYSRPCC